jgi:metal-responsive CopG/Arc/MetJ family transcriptional regulator
MKIAISVPETTFVKADALAKRLGTSRSAVFTKALDAYEADQSDLDLTAAANRFADEMTDEMRHEQEIWLRAGARTALRNTEW